MQFHIITIFPDIFQSYFSQSILGRAIKKGIIKITIYNLRQWADEPHYQVDDRPYGGGPGMVMMAKPIIKALKEIKSNLEGQSQIILFSAGGQGWTQAKAKRFAKLDHLIMVCGRYEGVDERVKHFVDKVVSIGPYILTGGEIPAMVVVDSITRLLPGVLGNVQSIKEESFVRSNFIEYPQYTRPKALTIEGKKYKVPATLLSGNHKKIAAWRQKRTKK